MAAWLAMLGTNLLMPVMWIGMGLWLTKAPPKYRKGGNWTGYRSGMSQKNADTWEFANRYSGRIGLRAGLVGLPVAVLAMLPVLGRSENVVGIWGTVVMCVLVVALTVPILVGTERALRRTFTRDGTRRDQQTRRPTTGTRRTGQSRGTGRDPRSPRRGTR